jgi:hypothetical protein
MDALRIPYIAAIHSRMHKINMVYICIAILKWIVMESKTSFSRPF